MKCIRKDRARRNGEMVVECEYDRKVKVGFQMVTKNQLQKPKELCFDIKGVSFLSFFLLLTVGLTPLWFLIIKQSKLS